MKIYIAQPMAGLSESDITESREIAIKYAEEILGEDIAILNSYFPEWGEPMMRPLDALGRALSILSEADVAFFYPGWKTSRGCTIEYDCCTLYGIKTIEIPKEWIFSRHRVTSPENNRTDQQ